MSTPATTPARLLSRKAANLSGGALLAVAVGYAVVSFVYLDEPVRKVLDPLGVAVAVFGAMALGRAGRVRPVTAVDVFALLAVAGGVMGAWVEVRYEFAGTFIVGACVALFAYFQATEPNWTRRELEERDTAGVIVCSAATVILLGLSLLVLVSPRFVITLG